MPDGTFGIVLDSSAVIAHFRRRIDVFALAAREPLYLPLISLGELLKGAAKSSRPDYHRGLIDDFRQSSHLVFLREITAEIYAEVATSLERRGRVIPENDMWIAAIALEFGLPLATRDAHFENVEGLTVLRW